MSFKDLLIQAKDGSHYAQEKIFLLYRPLLFKEACVYEVFDEDLFQQSKEFESKESLKGTAIWETAFSKTLKWFYGIPTVISIAYLVVQLIQYCPCKGV